MTFAPHRSIQDPPDVLGLVRELCSRRPEAWFLEPYELQSLLWSLGFCEHLIPEGEIAAALEALRVEGEVLP
jgi:hypothetical protein